MAWNNSVIIFEFKYVIMARRSGIFLKIGTFQCQKTSPLKNARVGGGGGRLPYFFLGGGGGGGL